MEIKKLTQAEWLSKVTKYIRGGLYKIVYGVVELPVAIVHRKTQIDEELCRELGYDIVESYNNGGTIVSNPGDVLIGHFAEIENGWHNRFTSYFLNWLKARGLNAELITNDIVVDGYKVCGMCITRYGRIDYTGGIISMNVNLAHIKTICRKPMTKVPKGLYDFGITTEEIEQMFLDFCEIDAKRAVN